MIRISMTLFSLSFAALSAQAQGSFTTAAEVAPILDATKSNWVAVREYDGKDWLYVTQILSWRCGLESLSVGLNGASPEVWEMEPCHIDTATPNALLMETHQPYRTYPLGSIETIEVEMVLDDGTKVGDRFERKSVQMP
ncbi:MAG: hypothetical protein AAGF79_03985 [Pseudomonadota bacterium]